jgi:tRNA G18 (ribose-2'-O)-methylase SpoU
LWQSDFLCIFAGMKVIRIDSLEVPEVAVYAHLTEAQLRNRLEPEKGVFIVESEKVIRVALAAGLKPLSFLSESKYIDTQVRVMCEDYGVEEEVPVYTGEREVLAGLTGYELTRGVLCAMHRPTMPSVAEILNPRPAGEIQKSSNISDLWITPKAGEMARKVAVLDSVVNSTNTGAIFRAAAALGIDALLLTRTCCDPLNRRACRVSMGTVFQIPWTWLDHYGQLKELGFKHVALALTDRSVAIDDPCLKEPERLAIIMGTEGDGLSDSVLRQCDYVAKIPMQRGVDSLNVAAAASVAFYELRVKN